MSAPYAVLPSPPPSASPKEMSFTIPTITTFDPSHFQSTSTSPAVLSNDPFSKQVGSRYETVPHAGPGTATYCRQPTRAQLKANNGLFADAKRPFWYCDPEGQAFIDADGNESGPRWVMIDLRGLEEPKEKKCTVM